MTDAPESPEISAEELERLRAENAALKKQLASGDGADRPRQGRRWLSLTCAVIGGFMLLLSVVTVWTRTTLLDTEQYVATVDGLARDESIQAAVSARVADAVAEELDFETVAEEALPEDAAVLAGPIASGAKSLVQEAVSALVATDQFARIWEDANELAHENVVAVMTGEGGDLVETSDGKIVLDLTPLADEVLSRLDEQFGADLTGRVDTEDLPIQFTLVESQDLADAQDAINLFDTLSWLPLLLGILFLAGAVFFAEDRRVGFRRLGLAIVISMVLAGLLYTFARNEYLTALSDAQNPDAARATFDILTRFLQRSIRAILVLGVVILLGAWVVGPSAAAAKVRSWWDTLLGRATEAGAEREVGPVPVWIAAHERSLQIATLVLAVFAVVSWTRPTGLVILFIAIVALLVAGAIRLVAEVGRQADTSDDDATAAPEVNEPTPADTIDA